MRFIYFLFNKDNSIAVVAKTLDANSIFVVQDV